MAKMNGTVGSRVRKVLIGSAIFALVGAVVSSYLGPKIIAWYFDPPVDIGINCRSAVEWSMNRLKRVQLGGLIMGLLLGGTVMVWFTGTKKLRDAMRAKLR